MRKYNHNIIQLLIACLCELLIFSSCIDKQENIIKHESKFLIVPTNTIKEIHFKSNENVSSLSQTNTRNTVCTTSITKAEEEKITSIIIGAYNSYGSLVNENILSNIKDNQGEISLDLNEKEKYTIYALINTPAITFPRFEKDLKNIKFTTPNHKEVQTNGLPMCGKLENINSGGITKLPVERLMAKIIINLNQEDMSPKGYSDNILTDIYLTVKQQNKYVTPFNNLPSKANCKEEITNGDTFGDLSEISTINNNGITTAILYIPENKQGKLLEGNTDPWQKTPGKLISAGEMEKSGVCTYLEFNCTHRKDLFGAGGGLLYRIYLGNDNTGDFNIERNTSYVIDVSLTREGLKMAGNWKVDKDINWEDNRKLSFKNPPYYLIGGCEATEIKIEYKFNNQVKTGMKDDGAGWKFVFDSDDFIKNDLSYSYDETHDIIRVKAGEKAIAGNILRIKLESFDGVICDESYIKIVPKEDIRIKWQNRPKYKAQKGLIVPTNLIGNEKVTYEVEYENGQNDGKSLEIESFSNGNCSISAINACKATIKITTNYNRKTSIPLEILNPKIKLPKEIYILHSDGTHENCAAEYYGIDGSKLNFDPTLYERLLKPKYEIKRIRGKSNLKIEDLLRISQDSKTELYVYDIPEFGPFPDLIDNDNEIATKNNEFVLLVSSTDEQHKTDATIYIKSLFRKFFMHPFGGKIEDKSLLIDDNEYEFKEKDHQFEQENIPLETLNLDMAPEDFRLILKANNKWSPKNDCIMLHKTGKRNQIAINYSVKNTDTSKHAAGEHSLLLEYKHKGCGKIKRKYLGQLNIYVYASIGAYITKFKSYYEISAEFFNERRCLTVEALKKLFFDKELISKHIVYYPAHDTRPYGYPYRLNEAIYLHDRKDTGNKYDFLDRDFYYLKKPKIRWEAPRKIYDYGIYKITAKYKNYYQNEIDAVYYRYIPDWMTDRDDIFSTADYNNNGFFILVRYGAINNESNGWLQWNDAMYFKK